MNGFKLAALLYCILVLVFMIDFYMNTELYSIENDPRQITPVELTTRQTITANQFSIILAHIVVSTVLILYRFDRIKENMKPLLSKLE